MAEGPNERTQESVILNEVFPEHRVVKRSGPEGFGELMLGCASPVGFSTRPAPVREPGVVAVLDSLHILCERFGGRPVAHTDHPSCRQAASQNRYS